MCTGFVAFVAGVIYCHILWAQEQYRKVREMTVADLKEAIERAKVKETCEQLKWYNTGLEHAMSLIDIYAQWQEPETGREYAMIMDHSE